MAFPKPFARNLRPEPTNQQDVRRRKTPLELEAMLRIARIEQQRADEQAEMRKEAALVPGEWVSTPSGVALFVPERMIDHARRAMV